MKKTLKKQQSNTGVYCPDYLLAFIFSLCLLMLGLSACENDMAEVQRVISKEERAIERARDVEILYSDSAIVRVRIKAYTMLNHLDKTKPRREFPEGFIVDFFDERKQVVSNLSANYAMHYTSDSKIFMKDSVVVWNKKGERLEAEELTWDEKEKKVYSDEFVKMTTADQIIYGYGFTSNLEFTRWKIKQVTGEIAADDISGGL